MRLRRVLILGASLMQRPAIIEAKKLGCEVIAVDANANALCVKEVDRFENIDLKDIPALINFAKELSINGGLSAVFTAGTDFSSSVASITEALNLAGHSFEAACNASDKVRMRECFYKCNLPSPRFIKVSQANELNIEDLEFFSFPLVAKPSDSMGARGCQLIWKKDDVEKAIDVAKKFSRSGNVIVEEFIEGPEFSIEGLVFNNEVHITALADRHIYFSPYFVEMGHTIPSSYTKDIKDKVIDVFIKGVKALHLTHGACKGDIFFETKKNRAVIGEIAGRLSGGYMSGWTVPYSSNINVTSLALQLALKDKIELPSEIPTKENTKMFSSERAYISIPGVVKEVIGLKEAKESFNVKEVFPRVNIGERVFFPKNNVEKCGNVISLATTYEDAILASRNAIKKIFIRLKPNDEKTDEFLSSFNDNLKEEDKYPPNYFIFPNIKEGSLMKLLSSFDFIVENEIIYPHFFTPYLDFIREPMGLSIREALKIAFSIEKRLKTELSTLIENKNYEKLLKYWISFIRGGIQGIIYCFDTFSSGEFYA